MAALRARALADLAESGLAESDADLRFGVEMRYRGQMNEIAVAMPERPTEPGASARLREAFETLYRLRFGAGTLRAGGALEVVSFRVDAVVPTAKPPLARREVAAPSLAPASRRPVYLRGRGHVDAAIHDFGVLPEGAVIEGPAVIERDMTTIWVPPEAAARIDAYGNIEIRPEGQT